MLCMRTYSNRVSEMAVEMIEDLVCEKEMEHVVGTRILLRHESRTPKNYQVLEKTR